MLRPRHLCSLVLLMLAACGGGSGKAGGQIPPQTTPPAVVVTPATAQLAAGGSPVDFTAALTGTTATITWSLGGPGSLSSTSGVTVTYSPPATLPADTQASLTASGGGASGTATITLARGARIRVDGRIVGLLGNAAADITVSVGEQSTVTDENGRFSLEEVSTPYTLTAFSAAQNEVVVYEGLTRTDPTIVWRRPVASFDRSAEVVGVIDGGIPPSPNGAQTLAVFSSPETQTQGSALSPSYALPVNWRGAETITGSVHVLQVASPIPGGLAVAFPGYGVHTGVTVHDGFTSDADVTLTPPAIGSVQGTFSLPAGYVFFAKFLFLEFTDGGFMSIGFDDNPGLDFTYAVPGDIDASVEVFAEAAGPGVTVIRRETGIAVGSTGVLLALPEGAAGIAPADGADPVDAQTEFSWGDFPGGVFTVDFTARSSGPSFHVVTRANRTKLPQLAALPVPSGVQYSWTVTAAAPFGSVDEAAGPRFLNPSGSTLLESISDPLGFTTR